jgi:signal transduction histidine kinase
MSESVGARGWLREHRAQIVDLLLALVVLGYGLADVLAVDSDLVNPGLWTGIIVASSVAIFLRRRAPWLVLAFAFVVLVLSWSELAGPDPEQSPGFAFLATLIALFAVGAHAERPATYLAPVAFIAVFTLGVVFLDVGGPTDILFVGLFGTVAWGAGFLLRRSRGQTRTIVTQAERFHAEGEKRAREAVADERGRIARELHDAVAHSVSTMVLQTGAVRRRLRDDQNVERETLSGLELTGRQAVVELRRMLGMLREGDAGAELAPPPSLDRVEELVERARESGVPVELELEGEQDLPPGLDLSAYRIVQEALNNVAKHAPGASTKVTVARRPHQLRLDIVNEGGEVPEKLEAHHGHGLLGMRERVLLFGGELEVGPERSDAFAVRARLPVPAEENGE